MADSNITKRALSAALKELMETQPFSKISVGDICERCEMNRKSFYYHFRDKYDLVNWIYDTEFITVVRQSDGQTGWSLVEALCQYFYDNRSFYRKTLSVDGQNSFSEYFRSIIAAILAENAEEGPLDEETGRFMVDFYADAFVCAIKRWLLGRDSVTAEEFSQLLKKCLVGTSLKIVRDLGEK